MSRRAVASPKDSIELFGQERRGKPTHANEFLANGNDCGPIEMNQTMPCATLARQRASKHGGGSFNREFAHSDALCFPTSMVL
jgi:hypothetical protein